MGEVEGIRNAWGYVEGGNGALSAAVAKAAESHGAVLCTEAVSVDPLSPSFCSFPSSLAPASVSDQHLQGGQGQWSGTGGWHRNLGKGGTVKRHTQGHVP